MIEGIAQALYYAIIAVNVCMIIAYFIQLISAEIDYQSYCSETDRVRKAALEICIVRVVAGLASASFVAGLSFTLDSWFMVSVLSALSTGAVVALYNARKLPRKITREEARSTSMQVAYRMGYVAAIQYALGIVGNAMAKSSSQDPYRMGEVAEEALKRKMGKMDVTSHNREWFERNYGELVGR